MPLAQKFAAAQADEHGRAERFLGRQHRRQRQRNPTGAEQIHPENQQRPENPGKDLSGHRPRDGGTVGRTR